MTGMLELLSVIRSKFLILVIWALAGTAVAGVINLLLPVAYEADARILVAAPYWNDSTALADPNAGGGTVKTYGDTFTQQRMASYVRLVTTPMVADAVAKRLRTGQSGEELAKKLSGHLVPDTVVIQVRAQDDSPVRAAAIADAAAQQTIDVIKDVERPPFTTVSPVQPVLTEPASMPTRPISPRTALNIVSGAIVGFLIGLTYIAAYAGAREALLLKRFRGDGDVADDHVDVLGVLSAEEHLTLDEVHVDAKLLRLEIADRLIRAGSPFVRDRLASGHLDDGRARGVARHRVHRIRIADRCRIRRLHRRSRRLDRRPRRRAQYRNDIGHRYPVRPAQRRQLDPGGHDAGEPDPRTHRAGDARLFSAN